MNKIYDAIIGLVIGDALGVPYEFKDRNSFECTDMVGYGTYNQPKGSWSDDSSMTLATIESISRLGKVDIEDIANNFIKWLYYGEFTPYGEVFDVGSTTKIALDRYYKEKISVKKCGLDDFYSNGNGSLMRILPLAFLECKTENIISVSSITHANKISCNACIVYINIAKNLINGLDIITSIKDSFEYINIPELERLKNIEDLKLNDIKSSGYVINTLEAVIWCLINTTSYKECVLTAVNLGEDTDTISAIVGGLAGIYYGRNSENGIPKEWVNNIARKEWIKSLCTKCFERLNM